MELSDFPEHSPYSKSGSEMAEFTVKAVVLGIVLSAIMTAANVYLGLKAGMTVSASIPAAVISMGILRGVLRRGTILENNLVQTIASAGESLAAGIIFTIPGLILTGVWLNFHYWTVSLVALLGGVLGIMFMIPLRRTLIVEEVELKYPEGVACAEVLEAGQRGGRSVVYLFSALGVGAVITWFIEGIALFKGAIEFAFGIGKSAVGFGLNVSAALIGVGYIVGFNIALLVFIGGAIAWFVAIPIALSYGWPESAGGSALKAAKTVWDEQIRYMGIGAMVIGGLWSIFKMRRGVLKGIGDAFGGYRKKQEQEGRILRTETDMPMRSIVIIMLAMVVGIFVLYATVTRSLSVTARGGVSVVLAGEMNKRPAYGVVPVASGENEWQVEGTIYESIDERAYLLDVGTVEKEFTFPVPVEEGDQIEPPGVPSEGQEVTVTTAGNQVFSGVVTKVEEKSFALKMQLPKVVQVPTDLDVGPGGTASFDIGGVIYSGKVLAVQEAATHLLTNDGRRFIFSSGEMVGQQTNYRFGMSFIALVAMILAGFFFVAVAHIRLPSSWMLGLC